MTGCVMVKQCFFLSFQALVYFLQLLDSVHGHVGVVHNGVWAEGPSLSFEKVGDDWESHDFGDELNQEGEADQAKHNGQGGVQQPLAWEAHVSVGAEAQAAARSRGT